MKLFINKTVIITGASSGIGLALAIEFAKEGANLVLAARQYIKLLEIAQLLRTECGVEVLAQECDVSNELDCKNLIDQTITKFGKIDVLINNAGISMRALFNDLQLSVIKNLMDVNFWGTVNCTKYALPHLLSSDGSLVAISSIAGYRGLPGRTGYSASKFAINGFMESLRVEHYRSKLHIMVACPGFTTSNIRNTALDKNGNSLGETSMDEDKMMSSQEVARRVLNGVLRRKRTLIMGSQGWFAVTLNKFFPFFIDKHVFKLFAKEKNALIK